MFRNLHTYLNISDTNYSSLCKSDYNNSAVCNYVPKNDLKNPNICFVLNKTVLSLVFSLCLCADFCAIY